MTAPPVITDWAAVSPYGVGRAAFAAGIRSRRPAAAVLDTDRWQVPDERACLVPELESGELAAQPRNRLLDRATLMTLAAVGELTEPNGEPDDRTGIVLGTTSGSLASTMRVTRDSLTGARPHHVDTKTLPAGLMNHAATHCAIRYGIRGPNATLAGGRAAGLYALLYACRLLTAERADAVYAGAVEEYSEPRAWLAHHSRQPRMLLGEGGAVFRVERAGGPRRPLAHILAARSVFRHDGGVRASVWATLARAQVRADDVWAAISATGAQQELAELFGADALDRLHGNNPMGDTGAAAGAFAVSSALSSPEAAGRLVLITSTDPEGITMSVLLRLTGAAE